MNNYVLEYRIRGQTVARKYGNREIFKMPAVFFRRTVSLILAGVLLTACSLDASLINLTQLSELESSHRKSPDFTHGEVVTTSGGHQFTAVTIRVPQKLGYVRRESGPWRVFRRFPLVWQLAALSGWRIWELEAMTMITPMVWAHHPVVPRHIIY